MSLTSKILIKDKFALANFILLNEQFCELNFYDLYVIQVIEQYQTQYNKTIDFEKIEKLISFDINKFKQIFNLLINRGLISSEIIKINNLNKIIYSTSKFWSYVSKKLIEFDDFKNKEQLHLKLVDYITSKYNRYLSPSEISQIESISNVYSLEILIEIVNQSINQNSKYVETVVSLVKMYSEANLKTLEEIQDLYEKLGN